MYKTSGLFFLFFTRQTSKRALLLPCHALRGELKSSKKPKRPAPKAVARLKPGIPFCSPDAWRSMATSWQCKQSMWDVGCHCVDLLHFLRLHLCCKMLSWFILTFLRLFSDFSPRPTCSANLGPWCFSRQPQLASRCRARFTEADASRAPLHGHFPNLAWSLSERAQRCTKKTEPMRGRHQKWCWNGAEMDRNGAFGHDGWGRTFQDSIAPTTTGPWGPRKITDAQTHREHLKKDLATNFMFGKKICVMHFLHVGYQSLSELQYISYMLYHVMSMSEMSWRCEANVDLLRVDSPRSVDVEVWPISLLTHSSLQLLRQVNETASEHLGCSQMQKKNAFMNSDLVIP